MGKGAILDGAGAGSLFLAALTNRGGWIIEETMKTTIVSLVLPVPTGPAAGREPFRRS